MKDFFSWLIPCLAAIIFFFFMVAVFSKVYAAPSIERGMDNHLILLNATPCDGKGHKAYRIENNLVKSGCWYNDGKDVVTEFESVITKYSKKLFELGVKE